MAQRNGFKNIQIQAKSELYDLFEETFRESGANTKAEFLNWLLESYLSPDSSDSVGSGKVKLELEKTLSEKENLDGDLKKAREENETLLNRLALYETEQMKEILNKFKGEKLSFRNAGGKKISIVILDLPDVFAAIFNSVKID